MTRPGSNRVLELLRVSEGFSGTFGELRHGEELLAYTVEPPWRDNRPNVSCIPAGDYLCTYRRSPRFGWTYWVRDVPGRGFILIHAGNWGGDRERGFKSNTLGCILPGRRRAILAGQDAVATSGPTVRELAARMDGEPFELSVRWQ